MIKNIINSATWFLRTGVYPKKTPAYMINNYKDMNHLSSKKFAMTMIAISIIAFMYFASVGLLFLFPNDPHVTALVSMYKDMIVAIAAVAGTLVGIQGMVDWKHNSSSDTNLKSETLKEKKIEKLTNNAKEDDYKTTV
jgi:hypothetical protein